LSCSPLSRIPILCCTKCALPDLSCVVMLYRRSSAFRPSRLSCKCRHISIGHYGKMSTSPRRTLSSITRSSGGSSASTALPHETKCQAISTHPLALNSTRRLPSGMSVITWFGWNRKSRATGAALGAKHQRTGPCSAQEKNDPKRQGAVGVDAEFRIAHATLHSRKHVADPIKSILTNPPLLRLCHLGPSE